MMAEPINVSTGLLIEALAAAGMEVEANAVASIRTHVMRQLEKQTPEMILADLTEAATAPPCLQDNPFPPLDLAAAIADPPSTWKTGLRWFDDAMADGGMQESWKIVLAAPPGCGKTALVLQVLRGFLRNQPNAEALYMAGEMSRRQLAARLVQQESNLPAHALNFGTPEQIAKRDAAMVRLENIAPRLHVMDPPTDLGRIKDQAYRYAVIVVDYLQLVRPADISAGRVEQLDAIMAELAAIAATSGCTFLIVSAMPRGGATTKSRNIFEAFKGSSAIEYTADVAFVGEVEEQEPGEQSEYRDVRWRCLKNRHGSAVDMDLVFHGPSMRFDQRKHQPAPAALSRRDTP
jgi:replicative DNA helicase